MKNEELKMQNVFISIHPFCIKTGIKSAAVTGVGPSPTYCRCLWLSVGSGQVILLILQVKHTENSCFFALKRSFGPPNGHYKDWGLRTEG